MVNRLDDEITLLGVSYILLDLKLFINLYLNISFDVGEGHSHVHMHANLATNNFGIFRMNSIHANRGLCFPRPHTCDPHQFCPDKVEWILQN